MLDHERLDVYRASLDLVAEAVAMADRLPRGSSAIADQLRRAAVSVPLNIAEAMGRSGRDDRRRHLTIARGSAMECGALFDVIALLPGSDPSVRDRKPLVERIVAMLTRLRAARYGT